MGRPGNEASCTVCSISMSQEYKYTLHELTSSVAYNDPHSVAGLVGVSQKCSESAADIAGKKHERNSYCKFTYSCSPITQHSITSN